MINKKIFDKKSKFVNKKENDKNDKNDIYCFDSDENFSFIAGYTSGGAPYGNKWKEQKIETDTDTELPW